MKCPQICSKCGRAAKDAIEPCPTGKKKWSGYGYYKEDGSWITYTKIKYWHEKDKKWENKPEVSDAQETP